MTNVETLLTAPAVVVRPLRQLLSQRADFRFVSFGGDLLAEVVESPGSGKALLGNFASVRLVVSEPGGAPLFLVDKPSRYLRSSFLVLDPAEQRVGVVEQENAVLAPQFSLSAVDGLTARLTGGGMFNGVWAITGPAGPVASVSTPARYGGAGALGYNGYVVELDASVSGPMRAVALMAILCLDVVRVLKRRRSG
jgi:hypothetical protein